VRRRLKNWILQRPRRRFGKHIAKRCNTSAITKHRMDYPTYVRNGWQIGSGPVESACKTVVGNRLKGGGMRWGEDGANAVCHLRAPLPQRTRLLGILLEPTPQLTLPTNLTLTRKEAGQQARWGKIAWGPSPAERFTPHTPSP